MALGFHVHIHLILKVLEEPGKVNKSCRRFCHSGISPVEVLSNKKLTEKMGNERALHTEPTGVVREGGQSSSKEDSAGVCEGKSLLPEGGIRNIR